MAINNRKLLLLCNPGIPGVNYVSCVPDVLKRYKEYFKSAVGGAWTDGQFGEIIEEPQGMGDQQEVNWLTEKLGEINKDADYAMIMFVGHGDAYLEQDWIQLSQGGFVSISEFLPLQGEENFKRRTVIVDACRSLRGGNQQQLILEQRVFSGNEILNRQSCREAYNEAIEACEPHTELIQSTCYGQPALVNPNGTGTAFSDAFFGMLNNSVPTWINLAQGIRGGGITKTTNQMMPAITMGMQGYSQVPKLTRVGNGNGNYPIFAVRRP
jgi:hypothetical protein